MRNSLAALLFACLAGAAGADLGTLFHTPQERKSLDKLRRPEPAVTAAPPPAPAVPDPAITGYVKRSDGKSTVFLDKQPYPARDASLQRLLEPRVIERYEPAPAPVAPPPAEGEDESPAAKPQAAGKAPGSPPKGGKRE